MYFGRWITLCSGVVFSVEEGCFFSFYGLLVDFFFYCYCILSLVMTARASLNSASFLLMKCVFLLMKSAVNKVRISNLTGKLNLFLYISEERNAKRKNFLSWQWSGFTRTVSEYDCHLELFIKRIKEYLDKAMLLPQINFKDVC